MAAKRLAKMNQVKRIPKKERRRDHSNRAQFFWTFCVGIAVAVAALQQAATGNKRRELFETPVSNSSLSPGHELGKFSQAAAVETRSVQQNGPDTAPVYNPFRMSVNQGGHDPLEIDTYSTEVEAPKKNAERKLSSKKTQ
jgi:hypothetical protein